jgi:hypothetical protein
VSSASTTSGNPATATIGGIHADDAQRVERKAAAGGQLQRARLTLEALDRFRRMTRAREVGGREHAPGEHDRF